MEDQTGSATDNSRDATVGDEVEPVPTPGDDGGTGAVPKDDTNKRKLLQEKAAAPVTAVSGYRTSGLVPQPVAAPMEPWAKSQAPLVDKGIKDKYGVRMFSAGGKLWNHPVDQAQLALTSLVSYKVTGNKVFLDRAKMNAQRNIDRRVESRGAWWYPYDFDWHRCAGQPALKAPWYSAMAQGELLDLFLRLYEVTKDAK